MQNEIEAKNVDDQVTSSHREERLVLGSSLTPETDAAEFPVMTWPSRDNPLVVRSTLARKLETERDELRAKYAMHHAEAKLITGENIRLKCTLAKWYEWARMHGHLEHAAGIADDSRRLISSENEIGEARADNDAPNHDQTL